MLLVETVFVGTPFFGTGFFCFCNFIKTEITKIVDNSSQIFAIFTSSCGRIPNIIFFSQIMFFWIFVLTQSYITWVTFSTVKLMFTVAWYMFWQCFWFISSYYHIKNTFKSSVSCGIHILLDRSLRVLQLPIHQSELTAKCSATHSLSVFIRV